MVNIADDLADRITAPEQVMVAAPSSDYFLMVSIIDQSGAVCVYCARDFDAVGGRPVLHVERHALSVEPLLATIDVHAAVENDEETEGGFSYTLGAWFFRMRTKDPGTFTITVGSNLFASHDFPNGRHTDRKFPIVISELRFITDANGAVGIMLGGVVTGAQPTVAGADPKTLQVSGIPAASSGTFALVEDATTDVVAFTSDEWKSYRMITFNQTTALDTTVCAAPSASKLQNIIAYRHGVLVQHTDALFFRSFTKETWTTAVSACITKVLPPTQTPPFNQSSCVRTMALSTNRAYVMHENDGEFVELLDADGKLYHEANILAANTVEFLSATASGTDCNAYHILASVNGAYTIVKFNATSSTEAWSDVMTFPLTVSHDATGQIFPLQVYHQTAVSISTSLPLTTMTLTLTAITIGRAVSNDMFAYGNALLYSPNNGRFWYLLMTFDSESVHSFATSKDHYAFILSNGDLWFGQIGTGHLMRIPPESIWGTLAVTAWPTVMFDVTGNLYALILDTATTLSVVRTLVDVQASLDYLSYLQNLTCPYTNLHYGASADPYFTRNPIDPTQADFFPTTIFLDDEDTYTFRASFGMTEESLGTLDMNFLKLFLSSNEFINVTTSRAVDYDNQMVTYTVNLHDRGIVYTQEHPGINLKPTLVRFMFGEASLPCRIGDHGTNNIKSTTVRSVELYSGCQPYQELEFAPIITDDCPDDIPCGYFETGMVSRSNFGPNYYSPSPSADFAPRFIIVDKVTNAVKDFTGSYVLRAIATGLTPDSMVPFTDRERAVYNPGEVAEHHLIWSPIEVLPVTASGEYILKGASTIIAFACSVDSPCIDIVPTFPETPAYYIQFEMVTAGVSKGDTYCDYSTRFLFRVYGMPTSSHVMLNVFLVVLSIGAALIVAITVYVRWRVQCLEKLLEATLQGQGFNAEIALLNPESMMGNENVGEPIWFEYEYPVDDGYYDPQGHALYKMKREHPEQFAAQRKKVAATKVENAATAALIKPTAEVSAARPTTDDEHVEEIQVEARPVSGRQRATDSSHRINFPEAVSRHGSRNDLARVHSSSGALFSDGRAPSLRMLNEELHRSNNNIHALLQGRNQVLASTTPAFHGGLQLPSDLGSSAALATSSATHDHDASISIEVEDTVAPLVRSPSFTSRRNSLTMSSPQQSPAQMHRFMQAHAPALDILSETEQSVRALPTLSDEIDSEEEIEDVTVVDPAAARAMLYEEATTPAARRRHLSGTQFAASPSFSHRSRFNEMNSAAAAFAASRRASLKEGDALMVAESQRRLMVAQIAASIGKPVEDAIDVDISKDEADAIMRTPRRRTSLKLMALSLGGGSSGNSPAARRMSLNGTDNGVEMDDERMAIMQLRRLSVGGQSSAVDPLVATPMTIHQRRASIVRQQQSQPDVTPPIPVNVAAELEAERIREELINLIGYDLVVAQEEAKRKRDDQSAIVMGGDDDAASDQS